VNYIAVDTEGSGLFDYTKPADAPGQPRLAAIGMILADENLGETERHSFLIRPNGWFFDDHSEAARVNGLTHERLMDEGIDVKTALRIYGDAIDNRRIVVGHNILHDLKMMRAEARLAGFPDRFMETRYICTMQGSRQIVDARTADGKKKAPKLEEACAHFNIEAEEKGAHTGIGGAERALEILRRLRDLGAMPAFKDPYDKGKKADPKPRNKPLTTPGLFNHLPDAEQDIPDFIGGASEDGK
jgi:DNA polymerase III epsilon subunit-like protein